MQRRLASGLSVFASLGWTFSIPDSQQRSAASRGLDLEHTRIDLQQNDRRHARSGVISVQSTIIPRAMLIVPPNQPRTCRRRHYAQVAGARGTIGWPPFIATATARASTPYAATDTCVTAAPCDSSPPLVPSRLLGSRSAGPQQGALQAPVLQRIRRRPGAHDAPMGARRPVPYLARPR